MVLKIKDLKKTFKLWFKKTEVLKWVNLEVKKWEIFGFLGPNWAWKTTTIKAILDFIKPTSGEILIFGEKLSKNRKLLKKIGFAPEQAYYYDHLTGEEFMYFMWKLSGLTKTELKEKVPVYLEKVGLDFASKRYIKTYSKGMKQRLGLAAAIIHEPELVFFDEPMSGLDPLGRNLVKTIMKELNQAGTTIFFNTHILSDVQEIAHRFSIINKWKVIFTWKVADVKGSLEQFFVDKIKSTWEDIQIK